MREMVFEHEGMTFKIGLTYHNRIYFKVTGGYVNVEELPYWRPGENDEDVSESMDDIGTVKNPVTLLRKILEYTKTLVYTNNLKVFGFEATTEKKRRVYLAALPKIQKKFPNYDMMCVDGMFWGYKRPEGVGEQNTLLCWNKD